jgi:hypothetical protein
VQLTATFLAAFVQVGVKEWLFGHVKDICQSQAQDHLVCAHVGCFFFFFKGPDRTDATIWQRVVVQPTAVPAARGSATAGAILAMATTASKLVGQVRLDARSPHRDNVHPARDGDQLLELVLGRVHLPVCDPAQELCVVEQV